jgi:uncharacterized membrane protein (DUF2068 family)
MHPHLYGPRMLALIAAFKFVKSAALIVLSIVLFRLRDPSELARLAEWLGTFPVTTGHEFVGHAIRWMVGMDAHTIGLFAMVALTYAVLYGIEGVGLWHNTDWAKYLTVITTCLFIPLEIWEIARRFAPMKVLALVINIAIVIYLIWLLRQEIEAARRAGVRANAVSPPS